ncbi:unnamed protein product, partial [Mesorhabditis spiculigera]
MVQNRRSRLLLLTAITIGLLIFWKRGVKEEPATLPVAPALLDDDNLNTSGLYTEFAISYDTVQKRRARLLVLSAVIIVLVLLCKRGVEEQPSTLPAAPVLHAGNHLNTSSLYTEFAISYDTDPPNPDPADPYSICRLVRYKPFPAELNGIFADHTPYCTNPEYLPATEVRDGAIGYRNSEFWGRRVSSCKARCHYYNGTVGFRPGPWFRLESGKPQPMDCDFIYAECYLKSKLVDAFLHNQVYRNKSETGERPAKRTSGMPDVILIVLDSVATSQAERSLPKTLEFLVTEMSGVQWPFLNRVGSNSMVNGLAILHGKRINSVQKHTGEELEPEWDWDKVCNQYRDNDTGVVTDYEKRGYKTLFGCESSGGDIWAAPNCKGYSYQPTHHYFGPAAGSFYEIKGLLGRMAKGCWEPHNMLLDYLSNFYKAYPENPKLGIIWPAYIGHNNPNELPHSDIDFKQWFDDNRPLLTDSFIFFMADHGPRYGNLTTTKIGQYEANNPMLVTVVPEWLRANKRLMSNLRENSKHLVTQYDVYATLMDILETDFDAPFLPFRFKEILRPNPNNGTSLLRPLGPFSHRTCRNVLVSTEFCLCQYDKILKRPGDVPDLDRMGQVAVTGLNQKLRTYNVSHLCEDWRLKRIDTVAAVEPEDQTQLYKIIVTVDPGAHRFEATIRRDPKAASGVRLLSLSERLTSYGHTANFFRLLEASVSAMVQKRRARLLVLTAVIIGLLLLWKRGVREPPSKLPVAPVPCDDNHLNTSGLYTEFAISYDTDPPNPDPSDPFSTCRLVRYNPLPAELKGFARNPGPCKNPGYVPATELRDGAIGLRESAFWASRVDSCQARCLYYVRPRELGRGNWVNLTRGKFEPMNCDWIHSECYLKSNLSDAFLHNQIYRNNSKTSQASTSAPSSRRPDVILIVLDSVAMTQAERSLPKTLDFLVNEMGGVLWPFLNRVGENSMVNAFAFLHGKRIRTVMKYTGEELAPEWNRDKYCYQYRDNDTGVVTDYGKRGYKTLFGCETSYGDIWASPNCKGYSYQPTHHHAEPASLAWTWPSLSDRMRAGCWETHHWLLDYLSNFLKAYPEDPKLGFLWPSHLAHDDPNELLHADVDFKRWFQDNRELLSQSFIFFMGDHGPRFGPLTQTKIGHYEVNNPLLVTVVPERLRGHEQLIKNLQENAKHLVTQYDVHATLMDILETSFDEAHLRFDFKEILKPNPNNGTSLLRPLGPFSHRTCRNVPTSTEHCLCQYDKIPKIPNDVPDLDRMAQITMEALNQKVRDNNITDICVEWTLDKVPVVTAMAPENVMQIYIISVIVNPGQHRFEGTLRRDPNADGGLRLLALSERLTAYGNTADCVEKVAPRQIDMRKYCHCRKQK